MKRRGLLKGLVAAAAVACLPRVAKAKQLTETAGEAPAWSVDNARVEWRWVHQTGAEVVIACVYYIADTVMGQLGRPADRVVIGREVIDVTTE